MSTNGPSTASSLLEVAEKTVLAFHRMVENSTGDQVKAATALLELTLAINSLAEEVKKGKEMVEQFSKLKEMLSGLPTTFPDENQQKEEASPPIDANKLLEDILSQLAQAK